MTATIKIKKGDITQIEAEAIVNAANKQLAPGGGVAGAIHWAGGEGLTREAAKLGGCETGEAKITGGHELPARYVIHTVGPVYGMEGGKEAELLADCYRNSLDLAQENDIKTIVFPAISTGAFGYPGEEAAKIAIQTVKEYLRNNPEVFTEIIFVLFSESDYEVYKKILDKK